MCFRYCYDDSWTSHSRKYWTTRSREDTGQLYGQGWGISLFGASPHEGVAVIKLKYLCLRNIYVFVFLLLCNLSSEMPLITAFQSSWEHNTQLIQP